MAIIDINGTIVEGVVLVTKRSAEELGLTKGKQIYANFKVVSIHVIRQN